VASKDGHHVPGTPYEWRHGWIPRTVPHTDVRVGDRLDRSGKTRVSKVHRIGDTTLIQTKTKGARSPNAQRLTGDTKVFRKADEKRYTEILAGDLSAPDARRSPAVSSAEFQQHAKRGEAKIAKMKGDASPPSALEGAEFKRLTDEAYDSTRQPWGGLTVDAHTGKHVAPDLDAYALTMRDPTHPSVHIDPKASREDFDNAMDEARKRFAEELSRPGAHLGVFYDEDTNSIDIDPVLVTDSLSDVHDIGAFTHAVGGAYHFKSGDGYWPPHVEETKKMDLAFNTPVLHDGGYDLSTDDGQLAFWKQILPERTVHYTAKDGSRQQIDFTKDYLESLASASAVDTLGFLLADKDNAHTMDPERLRGRVTKMEYRADAEKPGLYGKIVFPNKDAASAVLANPDLGVSARIRPNVQRDDGTTIPAGIIHVLGTLDPQVSGMSPWQATDLSTEDTEVLDLTNEEYEDMAGKNTKALKDYTEADIEAMTEEELDAFLAEFVPDFDTYTGEETDEHEAESDEHEAEAEKRELVGADMSKKAKDDIELANQAVASANARANEALKRVAEAEWREERNTLLGEGVPPHALDLAAPVLNRADDMVIDLSNEDGEDVNASQIVRDLLDSMKGMVDLSTEEGHSGTGNGDEDAELLAKWDAE
jgi:hypothetical protein